MKTILCIVDGLGICDKAELSVPFIQNNLDRAFLLEASGSAVGLLPGQMGNSEVGHMTIGAGRIIKQNLTRIAESITQDNFTIPIMNVVHLIGLFSDGGVHSHIDHLLYLINELRYAKIYLHLIADGRDCPPQSINKFLKQLQPYLNTSCIIATVSGRYYAMDRDKRDERTQSAYDAIAHGSSSYHFHTAESYVAYQYEQGITDEFFLPACNDIYQGFQEGDTVIFFNYRADRMRQIVEKIHYNYSQLKLITMTDYFEGRFAAITNFLDTLVITHTLGEILAKAGKKQLRIAETEKYAHVTFFLNCSREKPYAMEERILIPSPKVATYDLQPEMSAYEITRFTVEALAAEKHDFICVNYANADMVGHTGDFAAASKACMVLDECLRNVSSAAQEHNYILFITADHGNIEQMSDPVSKQPHTAHTLNKVPFICIGAQKRHVQKDLGLRDVAPTVLQVMGVQQPKEMDGEPLFVVSK